MNPCARVEAPALLVKHGADITIKYIKKRLENPVYKFQWPIREKQSLRTIVANSLRGMTQGRCSYCDGYPIESVGVEHIDHFKPKSVFPELVCEWANLFLSCSKCNTKKNANWDEKNIPLRPDEPGYSFFRYFDYNVETGELIPNNLASSEEQNKAKATIEIFNLNRAGARTNRKKEAWLMKHNATYENWAYRFLLPLFGEES